MFRDLPEKFPIHYKTHGSPTNSCIILITGLGGQLIQWPQQFIDGLVNQDLYVVTMDNRDSGLSASFHSRDCLDLKSSLAMTMSEELKPPYTFSDMADDVLHLMNHLSISQAHLLGSSMGGMIAQTFAIKYSDHLLSLILVGTSSGDPGLPAPQPEVMQYYSSFNSNNVSMESPIEKKLKLHRLYNPHFFNEEKSRKLFEEMQKNTLSPDGFFRQLLCYAAQTPRGEQLKNVRVNSLIIHGNEDPAFSIEHGKYLNEVLPNSQLEIIAKMGHIVPDELSDEIVKLIANFRCTAKYSL